MKKFLGILAFTLLPASAAAQSQTPILTIEDALRLARERNPEYRKVLNDLEVAEAQTRQYWGAFLPNLTGSLGFDGSSSTTLTGENDFGEVVTLDDARTVRRSSASQGASMNLTLFDGGKNLRNLKVGRSHEQSTEAAIRASAFTLTLNVTREFYDAVKAQRLAEVEERNLASAQERLDRTQAQFQLATTNQVDVLQATRSVVTAQRQIATTRASAEKAKLLLAQRLGMEGSQAFELSADLPALFDPTPLQAETLVARARASNPRVLQRQAAVITAENRASAARGNRWPTITGGLGYNRSIGRRDYAAWGDFNPRNYGYRFSLSATVPVFTRFQTSTQIAEADAAREDAQQDLRATMLEVERQVRSGLVDLQTSYHALQLAQENARISAEQVLLAEELYRAGSDKYNFLELQRLIDDNQAAQRDAVDAQFQFILMRAALEEILGGPLNL
jgi:outer membrane protein